VVIFIEKRQKSLPYRILSAFIAFTFLFSVIFSPNPSSAQVISQSLFQLPPAGQMVTFSQPYVPVMIKGLKIHPNNPLLFDFIVDSGHSNLKDQALVDETTKLVKYFLASLAVPEDDLWVNLSPYENDRIISESFGITDMGKDLLAQDYLLKQITASIIHPENELGKKFWNKVYKQAYEKYGTTDIPINTFNKVWILPKKAVVYQKGDTAIVAESRLKVMLEEDFLAIKANKAKFSDKVQEEKSDEINTVSSNVIKEIVIPAIEKEVNEGKNFANLRQVYNSLILANWYKKPLSIVYKFFV